MKHPRTDKLKNAFIGLSDLYNKQIHVQGLTLWMDALEDLTEEEIIKAIGNYLKSDDCKFFPMPGQLYQALKPKKEINIFYASREWQELRYSVLKKYGRKCMSCGTSRGDIHIDHIKPRAKYPELELDESNLQVLCGPCNLGKGAWDETDWRSKKENKIETSFKTNIPLDKDFEEFLESLETNEDKST